MASFDEVLVKEWIASLIGINNNLPYMSNIQNDKKEILRKLNHQVIMILRKEVV